MESANTAFTKHLQVERIYAKHQLQQSSRMLTELRKEILARDQSQASTNPERWGRFSYYTQQTETNPMPRYLRKDSHGHEQVVLDMNEVHRDGGFWAVGQVKLSADQQHVAYTVDTDGSEAFEARVQSIQGSLEQIDRLTGVSCIEWAGNDVLVYTERDAQGRPFRVMVHSVGAPQQEDVCILQEDREDCFLALSSTLDGAYVTVNSSSKTSSEVHLLSCTSPHKPLTLVQRRTPGLEYFVAHSNGQLFILTNAHGAVDYQIMTASLDAHSLPHWRALVPERPSVAVLDLEVYASHAVMYERHQGRPAVSVLNLQQQLQGTQSRKHQAHSMPEHDAASSSAVDTGVLPLTDLQQRHPHSGNAHSNGTNQQAAHSNNVLPDSEHQQRQQGIAQQSHQGSSHEQQQELNRQHQQHEQVLGSQLTPVSIPPWALSVEPGANPDYNTNTVRLHMASPVHPQHVYDYHLDSGQLQLLGSEDGPGHNSEQYVCQVQHATTGDGVQVPMTVMHKKGLVMDGSNPALVNVYGAYGHVLDTGFEPERLALLDRGWVIALAHVRGGGELGRRWHAAGRSIHKMNSVLDLEACLDDLLQKGYTRRGLVGVQGASAAGLLVAAVLNRRPQDLLAAILRVPFVDFLTSMTRPELPLTVHEYGEWGDPSDPAVLQKMRDLCPYQNIQAADYPPVLATCSVSDPRVPPWGPAKWAAKLRHHQTGDSPILLLSSSDTGHFGHDADLLENTAMEYAFLSHALQRSR